MRHINDVIKMYFKQFGDNKGYLVAIENGIDIPFAIERVFYIYGTGKKVQRGKHANRNTQFIIINISGTCKIKVIDQRGNNKVIELCHPHMGVYIPSMIWKEMYDFSENSILLVLASEKYCLDEYIRDYQTFISK